MAKTSENYRGLHKRYNDIMEELYIILQPEYEEQEDYQQRLIDSYQRVSEIKNELNSAVKNIKTSNINEKYKEEYDSMELWQNEINKRLKEEF